MEFWVVVVLAAFLSSTIDAQTVEDARCWERCFHVEDCPDHHFYKAAYNDFFIAGAEAMRLRNLYSVNGTALLFDTTLSHYHDPDSVMDSEESGARIFNFQKDLATIISVMLGSDEDNNPIFVAQFDSEKAWSCESWACMDYCEAANAIDLMECIHTEASGYRDNKIEPACRVANYFMEINGGLRSTSRVFCAHLLQNEMAIAFVNSDFDHNVERVHHQHDHNNHYSACQSHFSTRLAIGTHAVDNHELDSFQSPDARYIYIRDNDYTMAAAKSLKECMRHMCCDPDYKDLKTLPNDDTCYSATDDYTTEINDYSFMYNIYGTMTAASSNA